MLPSNAQRSNIAQYMHSPLMMGFIFDDMPKDWLGLTTDNVAYFCVFFFHSFNHENITLNYFGEHLIFPHPKMRTNFKFWKNKSRKNPSQSLPLAINIDYIK